MISSVDDPYQIVLAVLRASKTPTVTSRVLVRAGEILGASPSAIRVALTRLKQRGMVNSPERGAYVLGKKALALEAQVARWRKRGDDATAWRGGWFAVHTASLGRSDRAVLRCRERALRLHGFAEAVFGLELRPNNLRGGLEQVRATLVELGLEGDAPVFGVLDPPESLIDAALAHWDPSALERRYAEQVRALQRAEAKMSKQGLAKAAGTAFEAGDRAIRLIVSDPLLPAEFVDQHAREEFFSATLRFDRLGHALWSQVLSEAVV
ncbi:MAG: PaaX family transcriptional regulator [Myxococcota bacterium]